MAFQTPLKLVVTAVNQPPTPTQPAQIIFNVLDQTGATVINGQAFTPPQGASLADLQNMLQGAINNINQHFRNSGGAGVGGVAGAGSLAQLVNQTFVANS